MELSKYNVGKDAVSRSSGLEQWCYWIKYANEHTPEELRELLPGLAFLHATNELRDIQEITEEKEMYDSREKATLDYESNLIDARQEGRQEGRSEGLANGEAIGRVKTYQELLGEEVTSDEELSRMTVDQLVSMIAKLQARLRERNA